VHATDGGGVNHGWWCRQQLTVYTMAGQWMETTDGGLRRSIRNWSEGHPELKRMRLYNWMFIPTSMKGQGLKKGTNKRNGSQD